jgi:two-component system response regulator YesN
MIEGARSFSVLIVDDERRTREGLARIIPWQDLNLSLAGFAEDGKEALAMFEGQKIDIVITDVRMPKMDGIELARRIRLDHQDTELIFLSGYSDKEYLLSAIKVKAYDYIEKPIDPERLIEALKAMVASMMKKGIKTRSVLEELIALLPFPENEDIPQQTMIDQFERELMCRDSWNIVVVVFNHLLVGIKEREAAFQCLRAAKPDLVLAHVLDYCVGLCESEGINDYVSLLNARMRGSASIADRDAYAILIGKGGCGFAGLQASFADAIRMIDLPFFHGWRRTYSYADFKPLPFGDEAFRTDCIEEAIREGDLSRALNEFDLKIADFEKCASAAPGRIRDFCLRLASVCMYIRKGNNAALLEEGAVTCSFDAEEESSLTRLASATKDSITACFDPSDESTGKRKLVRAVEGYIRSRKSEIPNLNEMAELFKISPAYLSKLFKEESGKNFGDYVAETKLQHAKLLLKDPSLKVYEVAEAIGFQDRHYFTRLFKKATGMTPLEYRERIP